MVELETLHRKETRNVSHIVVGIDRFGRQEYNVIPVMGDGEELVKMVDGSFVVIKVW